MIRRWRLALIVTAVALTAATAGLNIASASQRGSAAGIPLLRVGLVDQLSTLDPSHNDTSAHVTSLALETLVNLTPAGKVVSNLAQSVTQPGPAVYVYHLRKGIKFWDGNELTSADVANALNFNRFPGSQVAFFYTSVKSITAPSRYTVVVTLRHPDASWPYQLASYGAEIFEKKFADSHKGSLGNPGVLTMGTGPWEISSFNPTSGVELSANPHYWRGNVPTQHISVKFFANENSMALALRAGAIDVAPQIQGPRAFQATSGVKVISRPSCQAGFFSMNTQAAPWSDVHVRRAVAYALNRNDIITALGGFAEPITTLPPPSQLETIASPAQVNALVKSLPSYPYNPAKARQELAKSSAYSKGFSFTLETYDDGAGNINVNQVIANELKAIGIHATVKDVGVGPFFSDLAGAPADRPPLYTPFGCLNPDPSYYPATILGKRNAAPGSYNIADYTPPAVDALVKAGVSTTNHAKRFVIYGKLLKQLAVDVPYIPLYVQDANLGISDKLSWPTFNANWYTGQGAWALGIKSK